MHLRLDIRLAICLLFVSAVPARSGVILNTLNGFDERDPGWSGQVDGLFSGTGGNTKRILFSAGGRVQWRGRADSWRLHTTGSYEESAGRETARDVVAHLRHNHDLGPAWATVLFAQVQHNPFQRLESRWLFGFGARYDLRDDPSGRVAVGLTPMIEIERIENEGDHHTRGRLSVFLYLVQQLSDRTRIDVTGFWQPLLSDLEAWRAAGNLALVIEINGHLDFKTGVAVEDDARPPAGVKRTDWRTYAGLSWEF